MNTFNETVDNYKEIDKEATPTLTDMEISKWNRSHGSNLDAEYVKKLAADIKANGMVNPVSIVMHKKTGRWVIVAGAHRVAAIKLLRGEDGVLKNGEFRIIRNLDESDPQCFDISVAENRYQRRMSMYDTAKYVCRVVDELKVNQQRVADALGLHRPYVNRVMMLVQYWDKLPDSVKSDFCKAPYSESENPPVLTFTWWYKFAPSLQKAGLNDEVRALMEKALAERWSTRQVEEAVQRYTCGVVTPANEQQTDGEKSHSASTGSEEDALASSSGEPGQTAPAPSKATKKQRPLAICTKAGKAIARIADLLGGIDGLDDVNANLKKLVDMVSQKIAELQEADRAAKTKGKKKRGVGKVSDESAAKANAEHAEGGK